MLYSLPAFSKNADREISRQQKVYLSDTGVLQQLAQVNSGQVFENAIALQLSRKGAVQYYQKLSGQEIDFIAHGNAAVEVKETPTESDFHSLRTRAAGIGIEDCRLVGRTLPASGFTNFYWGGAIV